LPAYALWRVQGTETEEIKKRGKSKELIGDVRAESAWRSIINKREWSQTLMILTVRP
jgi:hypothetical protein